MRFPDQLLALLMSLCPWRFHFSRSSKLLTWSTVHRGQAGETDFFKYALFVTFFPQLIAGPIVHHSEVMQQYERAFGQKLKSINVIIGLTLIAAGLFK